MTEIMRYTALYILLALLFYCFTFSNLKAQALNDSLWVPLGTTWVYGCPQGTDGGWETAFDSARMEQIKEVGVFSYCDTVAFRNNRWSQRIVSVYNSYRNETPKPDWDSIWIHWDGTRFQFETRDTLITLYDL